MLLFHVFLFCSPCIFSPYRVDDATRKVAAPSVTARFECLFLLFKGEDGSALRLSARCFPPFLGNESFAEQQ